MRKPYCDKSQALTDENILSDPFELFHQWFENAKQNAGKHTEINAVCLSTSYQNKPSSRMVLLKGYDPDHGFRIFTNYESRKGSEIVCIISSYQLKLSNQKKTNCSFYFRNTIQMLLCCFIGNIHNAKFVLKDKLVEFPRVYPINISMLDQSYLESVPLLANNQRKWIPEKHC